MKKNLSRTIGVALLLISAGTRALANTSVSYRDVFRHLKGQFLNARPNPHSSAFMVGTTWQCKGFTKEGLHGNFVLNFREEDPHHLCNTKTKASNPTWVRELESDHELGWHAGDSGSEPRHLIQFRLSSTESHLLYKVSTYDDHAKTSDGHWAGQEYGLCQPEPYTLLERFLFFGSH